MTVDLVEHGHMSGRQPFGTQGLPDKGRFPARLSRPGIPADAAVAEWMGLWKCTLLAELQTSRGVSATDPETAPRFVDFVRQFVRRRIDAEHTPISGSEASR